MKIRFGFLLVAALSIAIASRAHAFGNDITWNDCVSGPTASTSKTFTCGGTQNENYSLIFQFKSPISQPNFVAATFYFDLGPYQAAPLSPYWHYESGGCNRTGIALLDEIPPSCEAQCVADLWGGGFESTSAIAVYVADYQGYNGRGHFVLLAARGDGTPLEAGVNYFGVELRFNNRNRGTCAGCSEPKIGTLQLTRLESNDGQPAVDLSGVDKLTDCITINGGLYADCGINPPEGPRLTGAPPCGPTVVVKRTWGMLKSLYR